MVKLWVLVCLLVSFTNCEAGDARCPNTNCTPAPNGVQCDPSYGRDNGCCPVWTCQDGNGGTYTVYGMSSGSSSSSSSYSQSSYGNSGGGGMPMGGFSGLGAFPMFGGLFGR